MDANHVEIKSAYEELGCQANSTARVGGSFPDLVVSNYGLTWTVEVKDGRAPLKKGQKTFAEECKGMHFIVRDINGVIVSCKVMRDKARRLG